jgi:soluble cytochrome b562
MGNSRSLNVVDEALKIAKSGSVDEAKAGVCRVL